MKNYSFSPKRHNSEAILQELFVRWLNSKGLLYIASLMGVNLGARVGAIRKRMGCVAGVPDLLILEPRGRFSGLAIELKVKGGKATPEQIEFANRLMANNYFSVIMPPTMEIPEALEYLKKTVEEYLLENGWKYNEVKKCLVKGE